jgi:hypothetical protein
MTLTHFSFSYPLCNAVLIAPLSIVHWMQNAGSDLITLEESLAIGAIFGLSSITNVLLSPHLDQSAPFWDR